mmetsp:Transcript_14166/g.30765  ORF Transcript_14166/g.30765 Transcript_14166/m.30765 type:complete len:128 (-) Transcript_14166:697-1080(-)
MTSGIVVEEVEGGTAVASLRLIIHPFVSEVTVFTLFDQRVALIAVAADIGGEAAGALAVDLPSIVSLIATATHRSPFDWGVMTVAGKVQDGHWAEKAGMLMMLLERLLQGCLVLHLVLARWVQLVLG